MQGVFKSAQEILYNVQGEQDVFNSMRVFFSECVRFFKEWAGFYFLRVHRKF